MTEQKIVAFRQIIVTIFYHFQSYLAYI